jgi:polygalacturonase
MVRLSIRPFAGLLFLVTIGMPFHMSSTASAQASTPLSATGDIARGPGCLPHERIPISPNDFTGSDVERINSAIERAAGTGRRVVIPRLNRTGQGEKDIWMRNIGILLAFVENFRIENLRMKDTHAWAISLERCSSGYVGNIAFDSREGKEIDGKHHTILNQDGLNLRLGCHDITIENLSGRTGDDLLALTNTAAPQGGADPGSTDSTQVSGGNYREGDDLRNIYIRNIRGYSVGRHGVVRLLNTRAGKLYNIILDGVIDTSPPDRPGSATIRIGSSRYGGHVPLGHTRRLFIGNISGASRNTIVIDGTLADSFISNVIHGCDTGVPIAYEAGRENVRNVLTSNLLSQTKNHESEGTVQP